MLRSLKELEQYASATDNNSGPAIRPPRVTTKVATPLHRAAVGRSPRVWEFAALFTRTTGLRG
jgi:hypothetical protein